MEDTKMSDDVVPKEGIKALCITCQYTVVIYFMDQNKSSHELNVLVKIG